MNGWVVAHMPVTIWDRICNIQRAALLPHHLKDGGSGTIIGTGVGDRDHNRLRGQHIQQMWGDGIPVAMMRQLDKRLADMDMKLEVRPAAVEEIAKEGFDPVYGARPLRRAIQTKIEDALAEQLLEGRFQAGDTVAVDCENGVFTFTAGAAAHAPAKA